MRPQQNRRVRGRNNNSNGNHNNRRGPNPLSRNYESSGPDVKIRGNAQQIADKYISLARDAQGAGDRIMSENYLQHAEHYLRIILAAAGQASQSARRDENSEQECGEVNAEGEQKNMVDTTDTSQGGSQKNGHGHHHAKAQNGHANNEETWEENTAVFESKSEKEQSSVEENAEPSKKTRRPVRRRAARAKEEKSLEFPNFELSSATSETSQNGDAPLVKNASMPVVDKEIQKKTRRRRTVASSSVEENV
ncbi:hypothetical protein ABID23_001454 [Bartonella silvatica]|uniref:DUF4167 domain-containing protein n=1 Tax=Bartonella silvatica TaxID=357760 RepID=A0ABV2HIG3_9HYPH